QFFTAVKKPARELRQHRLLDLALDRRDVFFADAIARMRQAQRELSIIRQKNQSFAVEIQTTHGMDDLPLFWEQIINRRATQFIVVRTDAARRLVQRDVKFLS